MSQIKGIDVRGKGLLPPWIMLIKIIKGIAENIYQNLLESYGKRAHAGHLESLKYRTHVLQIPYFYIQIVFY